MNSRQDDLGALLNLLVYAKAEAERLELTETVNLLDLPALSVFLEYTGMSIEDVEKSADPMGSTIRLFETRNSESLN